MYINISYKFHRIPDAQSHFITKVHDLLGQPSYMLKLMDKKIITILCSRNFLSKPTCVPVVIDLNQHQEHMHQSPYSARRKQNTLHAG